MSQWLINKYDFLYSSYNNAILFGDEIFKGNYENVESNIDRFQFYNCFL